MPVTVPTGTRLYTKDGKTWPAVSDVAHYEPQVQAVLERISADEDWPQKQAVLDVLNRAGWDGVKPIGPAALTELSKHADKDGNSFAYNVRAASGMFDQGSEPGGGGDGGGTTATPDAVKAAEDFGRKNVRQDIGTRIQVMRRRNRTDADIVNAIAHYCDSGRWPGETGSGGSGPGLHLPGTES